MIFFPRFRNIFVIVAITLSFSACGTLQPSEPSPTPPETPSVAPEPTATSGFTPVPYDVPITTVSPTAPSPVATVTPFPTVAAQRGPILITTLQVPPSIHSFLPRTVWWSSDSQILYFQEVESQQAWAYELATGISESVPYVSRAYVEVAPTIEASLPDGATLFDVSPSSQRMLYRIPLAEPIPNPDDPDGFENPPYRYELWLREDGEDFLLGLVDSCFGILLPPLWSTRENVAFVNTSGAMGYPCLHDVWLLDLESRTVGALDSPWEGQQIYGVYDTSADGNLLLVKADINYFYHRDEDIKQPVPGADTARIILTGGELSPSCLFLDYDISRTAIRTFVWTCEPVTGKDRVLATIDGHIVDWTVAPDDSAIALIGGERDFFPDMPELPTGIWLLQLPQSGGN